jgi:hypothetical protein
MFSAELLTILIRLQNLKQPRNERFRPNKRRRRKILQRTEQ